MTRGADGRVALGIFLQVLGLVLMPAAVWYDLSHDDVYSAFLIAGAGMAFIMIGRSLRVSRVG